MSGIVGSRLNIRGSGVVGKLGTDGQVLTSSGAGASAVFEAAGGGAVSAINNATANELVTIGSTTTELDSETNLIYNGTILGAGATGASADLGAGIHIRTADSSADVSVHADELVIENSANTGLTILSGTSSNGRIMFGDSGDNDIGYVEYDHSTNTLALGTNAASALKIDTNGAMTSPTNPCFAVFASANQVIDNSGTNTLTWGGEAFDIGSNFTGNTFTAPVAGKYQFNVKVKLNDSGSWIKLKIIPTSQQFTFQENLGALQMTCSMSEVVLLAANDTVTITIVANDSDYTIDGASGSSYKPTTWSGQLIQ